MKRDNKGFSLIELIIVIAIMAVLVGILAPQFTKYIEKSKRTVDVNNAAELVKAFDIAEIEGATCYRNGVCLEYYWLQGSGWHADSDLIYDRVFHLAGFTPYPSTDKNLVWYFHYADPDGKAPFDREVLCVYLVEGGPGAREGYQLYPDASVFLNSGEKTPVKY